jgi:hypothetical protein
VNRLNVDAEAPAVKKFLRKLAVDAGGVDIELGGQVICKIMPPEQMSDAERNVQLSDVREMLQRARKRSKGVASQLVERDIRAALAAVRESR